ncbi:MAG TPA: PP2C family serine/threonine-protein phosphatase [Acidimicrobiales bacterium]|nr:PP2C family serine/threonine-protein phosphatase [Acidimicrobiales bacterium]
MTVLRSGSASDVGRVRTVNEDRALESPTLFAVADGMGGHAGGEVAASITIEALQAAFVRTPTPDGLVAAVEEANRAVWERGVGDQALRGMGTTVTAAGLVVTPDGDRLLLVNVGDSRAYRLHAGVLDQLSVDHSVAEELVAQGALSEEEAAVHPKRHILTRALGISPHVEVDLWEVVPVEGDRYLLCSDGLSNEVTADVLARVLSSERDPRTAAETLVGLANDFGGNDNITAVVVDVLVGEGTGDTTAAGAAATAVAVAEDLTGAVDATDARTDVPPASPPSGHAAAAGNGAVGVVTAPASRPGPVAATVEEAPTRRKGPRRITFRVLLFLILLGGLAYGAWYVIKVYVGDSYFVGLEKDQLVIYQGRPGGFLGLNPKIVTHTGVTTAQVGSIVVPALRAGVQEPTRTAANKYVAGLVAAQCSLENPPPTCAATTTTTSTVPVTTTPGGL